MDIRINYSPYLNGEITPPPSKSYAQRAMAAALLVKKLHIKNYGDSEDEQAALLIIKSTGAKIQNLGNRAYFIENQFDFNTDIQINCGESGLCARLFSGLMMLNKGKTKITGNGTLISRPMDNILDVYRQLDIEYHCTDGKLPLTFIGKNSYKRIKIDGSLSSQFITGIIYYLVGLNHTELLELEIIRPVSTPYIEMTMNLLNTIGAKIDFIDNIVSVYPSKLNENAVLEIESDWSAAANWAVAAAIGGNIRLKGLNPNSLQADKKILEVLNQYGAKIDSNLENIYIKNEMNRPFEIDAGNAPDLIPILVILAIFAYGESSIDGIERLQYKESNRLKCIEEVLKMIKIEHKILGNNIKITGSKEKINTLYLIDNLAFISYGDHRMTMSISILALFLRTAEIKGIESVHKSYPEFFRDLLVLGGSIDKL